MSVAQGTSEHWQHFTEFCEYELATGGPDPHARYIGMLAFPHSWKEIVWRGGVYAAVYNAPAAEAIYRAWPYERMATEPRLLSEWIIQHWAGIPLRRERRAVRTPEKLTRCLNSYAAWMDYQLRPFLENLHPDPYVAYDQMWKAADRALYGFGRYALTKLLDYYERYCDISISMPDIRPVDGWSPRETLQLFYPGTYINAHSQNERALRVTNHYAAHAKDRLAVENGLDMDWFRFEVLLCEYRQSCEEERQYPGRSIDSELKYLHAVDAYWAGGNWQSGIWQMRRVLHPSECLGEVHGWDGPRDDLGGFLNATGHTWSDLLWEYTSVRMLELNRNGWKERTDGRKRIRDLARATLGKGADKQPVPSS